MEKVEFTGDQVTDIVAAAVATGNPVIFVHDQGVYLMVRNPDGGAVVRYAKGCHPEQDDDWWEYARTLVGGDDFGEELPLEDFITLGWDDSFSVKPTVFRVEVLADTLQMSSEGGAQ